MRGYFGLAIYNGKTASNLGSLLRTAHILNASFVATIGNRYKHEPSDTMKTPRHIPLFHYDTFEEFKRHLPNLTKLIAIEIDETAQDLNNFIHPQQACYILGAEDTGIPAHYIKKCDHVLQLRGNFCFNVAVAGSIVLYDRINKGDS